MKEWGWVGDRAWGSRSHRRGPWRPTAGSELLGGRGRASEKAQEAGDRQKQTHFRIHARSVHYMMIPKQVGSVTVNIVRVLFARATAAVTGPAHGAPLNLFTLAT